MFSIDALHENMAKTAQVFSRVSHFSRTEYNAQYLILSSHSDTVVTHHNNISAIIKSFKQLQMVIFIFI